MQTISIILPVYNGGTFLKLSVESVLNQNFKNFELLIIDDSSTDGSREYLDGLMDKRIVYFKNKTNKGLFFNLNFLVEKSTTNLIKLWAQDDIMFSNCLGTIIDFHRKYPELSFSYSGCTIIDEFGKVIINSIIDNTPEIVDFNLHARIAFYTGSIAGNIANVCINKQKLILVGTFDESMKISGDFDMWVKLSKKGDIGYIKENIIYLRNHVGQLSRKSDYLLMHVKEDMIIYRNLLGYVSPEMAIEGRVTLRKHKFVFYYTLMVKEILKGNFKNAFLFYKELSRMEKVFKLSIAFVKAKLFKPAIPGLFQ